MSPNQTLFNAKAITIALSPAGENEGPTNATPLSYINIASHEVRINLHDSPTPVGRLVVRVLEKSIMDAVNKNEMFRQCQAFDNGNDGALLLLVEHFINEETFSPDKRAKIDNAGSILFIEEAYVDPRYRKHGVSLFAVDLLVDELGFGEGNIAILYASPIDLPTGLSVVEASDKLVRHWKRMGFEKWSNNPDSWLGLSLRREDRPKIEDVVPELFGGDADES